MQGPPGRLGRAEVFPSNSRFFLQSGDWFAFPTGGVSEGNPLLFACLGQTGLSWQDHCSEPEQRTD